MKIGIVTQSFTQNSGVAEHVVHTCKEMVKLGCEPTVITANFTGENNDRGLKVLRVGQDVTIPANGTFANLTVGYKMAEKLRRIFSAEKFDLLHVHCPLDPILPLWAVKVFKGPIVGTFHTYMKANLAYDVINESFKPYFKKLTGKICVSEPARDFIYQYFPADYRIIPNGVDTNCFRPGLAPIKKFDDDIFNLLFVGRIDPRKGLRYLLQAFSIVYGHDSKVRLIVVGKGILSEYYKMFLLKDLEDKVFFEGYVSAEEIPHYYATADIYCSPATHGESFGIVLLEAMASGKPVVASSNEGYKQVLSSKEGILVEPKNVVQLAKAIISLMDDKKKRKKMGEAGRKKAEKYSWKNITKQIVDYYQEVLKK
ncbi:MAG: glycosyltransferase family 1 protein [Candidatus Kerfeldbacteria bacterium CG_4_10_14_0_8_um_filter_42_10]|uniref:Glycosyltransferase family 1 protein n=1 Tax=Candidatus Kerfeldbacteria bacterium CG_4_10_14_0_8_um_filter_42_10 TaxID=2014248 RepID=A0A2M7RG97_9BACT|nr:MAG: glycosyltransferase family 1 protein [Candidatus Kerfeldbacteria bacterium CG_4_10_14_0_8_um_filter_42_10]